jgi:hypothetical protein
LLKFAGFESNSFEVKPLSSAEWQILAEFGSIWPHFEASKGLVKPDAETA